MNDITTALASDWPITLCFAMIVVTFIVLLTKIFMLKARATSSEQRTEKLEKQVALLSSSTVGMGNRLMALQIKLDTIAEKQEERSDSESQLAYARALRLLESGAEDSIIAANSGLSKSEIKLMQMVNRQQDSA